MTIKQGDTQTTGWCRECWSRVHAWQPAYFFRGNIYHDRCTKLLHIVASETDAYLICDGRDFQNASNRSAQSCNTK